MDSELVKGRLGMVRPTAVPLRLSVNVTDDCLEAIEFGSVVDGRPDSQLIEITRDVRYVLRSARGPLTGFTVHHYSKLDVDSLGEQAFDGPRFAIPLLGMDRATIGEVILA